MYENIKDCFISKANIENYLDDLVKGLKTDSLGNSYQFLYNKKIAGEEIYYFLTSRPIHFTGHEQTYINKYFYGVYGLLSIILVIFAFGLSKYISKPLIDLNHATEKLAALDFTHQISTKREDEIGLLAANINSLSKNLSESLEKLRRAKDESNKNEERMSLLLSDLAHEFRTPLGVILSHSEVFEKGLYKDKPQDYFVIIYDEIEKLSRMVNEAIELAQVQRGKWKINLDQWELSELITLSIKKFQSDFKSQGFTIHQDLPEVYVLGDAKRIDQVLSNLFSNVLKYSDKNKILEVLIKTDGDDAFVFVGNSGLLSKEEHARIWERYYSTAAGKT